MVWLMTRSAKAINSRIRKILHSFARKAYVGYTATPFANIFIDRRKATKEEGPDLFPQSFIINISLPPTMWDQLAFLAFALLMAVQVDCP
jgi:hypothetical protein